MNPTAFRKPTANALDIDALLQDSFLLVVELRQGGVVQATPELRNLCVQQVTQVREQLLGASLSQRTISYISHAQCALLDETVLACAKDVAHSRWAAEPLQAEFFGRHQAGEFLYEEMREVLRESAPDRLVLTVFQRVLMLGFHGRYARLDDPERLQLLAMLDEQVAPLALGHTLPTQVEAGWAFNPLHYLRSPLIHGLAVAVLLAAAWYGLDHLLAAQISGLLPGAM